MSFRVGIWPVPRHRAWQAARWQSRCRGKTVAADWFSPPRSPTPLSSSHAPAQNRDRSGAAPVPYPRHDVSSVPERQLLTALALRITGAVYAARVSSAACPHHHWHGRPRHPRCPDTSAHLASEAQPRDSRVSTPRAALRHRTAHTGRGSVSRCEQAKRLVAPPVCCATVSVPDDILPIGATTAGPPQGRCIQLKEAADVPLVQAGRRHTGR